MDIVIKKSMKDLIIRGYQNRVNFAREILEMDIHDEQEECLMAMQGKEEFGLTTGNRWGKGEIVMINGSWYASYKPTGEQFKKKNVAILNTSISQDQANIVLDKFSETLMDRPKFSWNIKDVKLSPFPQIIFRNGITWWFRNASQDGKFLEGRSYLYANFDEADLQKNLPKFLSDILWPRLWDYGGALTWTTTPRRGRKNSYKCHEELKKKNKAGNKTVGIYQGDSRNNKFLDKSAIVRMNALPQRLLNKNVKGIYEDTDGVISNEALDYCEMIADGLIDSPIPGRRYISTWDFARSHTFNTGVTIELGDPLQLRSWERAQDNKTNRNRAYWVVIKERVKKRHFKFRGLTGIDGTGLGDVMDSFLAKINPISFKLHKRLRDDICEEGVSVCETGGIGLPLEEIHQTINGQYWCARDELNDFDPEALDEIVWDFVCALFLGIWLSKGKRPPSRNTKAIKSPCAPRVKGISKHAMAV
ncbi:MAG: hypothetical protein GY845_09400 [Planctomycetes bacterium]|nr:hypothetical protein [Planctomycetota bacterium]